MGDSHHVSTVSCSHYRRYCNIWAPCCRKIVCCHRGHDESRSCSVSLTTNRSSITTIICMSCKRRQTITDASKTCRYCSQVFGQYFCRICRMWDKGPAFHCSRCGHCINNPRQETYHCTVCNMCYPITSRDHRCAIFDKCASCRQPLRGSHQRSYATPCGHTMHERCYRDILARSNICPFPGCRKPLRRSSGSSSRRRS